MSPVRALRVRYERLRCYPHPTTNDSNACSRRDMSAGAPASRSGYSYESLTSGVRPRDILWFVAGAGVRAHYVGYALQPSTRASPCGSRASGSAADALPRPSRPDEDRARVAAAGGAHACRRPDVQGARLGPTNVRPLEEPWHERGTPEEGELAFKRMPERDLQGLYRSSRFSCRRLEWREWRRCGAARGQPSTMPKPHEQDLTILLESTIGDCRGRRTTVQLA